jgi:hypothetical protein
MDSDGFPINSFYAISPLPYSFHNDQHRTVHCSTFWTHGKSLEDSLKIESQAHAPHAKAIKDMAKGNDVEALTIEQAYTRLERSKEAEERNGLLMTLAFSGFSTEPDIKTYAVFPEMRTKIVIGSGE